MIRRRQVYHVAGYDPVGAAWYRVFKRQLVIFARTWSVCSEASDPILQPEPLNVRWDITTRAPNWHVETVYEPMLWDDIVLADFAQPTTKRLVASSLAFLDIVMTGTAFRYLRASWQYTLFFLFPFFLLAAFGAAALAAAYWAASSFALPYSLQIASIAALGAAIFAGLLHWLGQRWRVQQALDDWAFSRDYLYGRRPDVEARLDRFAESLVARTHDTALDEIVVVGHSMGATLALEIVTRALALDPSFGRRGPAVCLLTVGSTIPKFTLHPAGERFRQHAEHLARESSIAWAEYHARSDPISFYKFDSVTLKPFSGDPIRGKPLLRRVRIQQMLTKRTYWRNRLRFMRMHYQFVMANELRSTYDFFMMVCGPIPFSRSVLAPRGPVELIAPDGSLICPSAAVPSSMPLGAGAAAALPDASRHETR
jgi:pimeloyl-ACP methyl ester carboxylesterase